MKSVIKKVNKKINVLSFFYSVFVVLILFLTFLNIAKIMNKGPVEVREVLAKNSDVMDEKLFWEKTLAATPDYLPGILELSKIEADFGNKEQSIKLLEKALFINPNDERVREAQVYILK